MVRWPALILLACSFASAEQGPKAPEPPKDLFRLWFHSVEEDTARVEVYRPAGFAFPPARGREGFEVRPKGVFVAHEIGPGDGTDLIEGRWKFGPGGVLAVTFPDAKPMVLLPGEETPPPAPRSLRILSCNPKVLKVGKPPAGKAGG